MFKILSVLVFIVIACSCGPRYSDYFPYHDDGRVKPVVTLLPLSDKSSSDLNWDLSEELTRNIHRDLMDDASLYLLPEDKIKLRVDQMQLVDFFGKDLQFAKKISRSEYVVAIEFIDHSFVPYKRGKITPLYPIDPKDCSEVLMMKLRIRIIDTREEPKIILQEVFQSNHMLSKENEKIDYELCVWGTDRYNRTPFGQAHKRLAKDLALRIEKIILSRQSTNTCY